LSLNQIADLFGRDKSVFSRCLRNVFKEGGIEALATVANLATVRNEDGRTFSHDIAHYNLDAILSVGYRVNAKQGTLHDFVDSAGNPGYFQQQLGSMVAPDSPAGTAERPYACCVRDNAPLSTAPAARHEHPIPKCDASQAFWITSGSR